MNIQNKILTVYSADHAPASPIAGDILLQNGTSEYKIYDGLEWQIQTGTNSSDLAELFSKDENYFYVNYNTAPGIEFVKKYTNNGWVDITKSRTGQLLKIAADAEAAADGKIKTYSGDYANVSSIAPNPDEGDLFIDTAHQNKLYRYSTQLDDNDQLIGWLAADDKRLIGKGDGVSFKPTGGGTNAEIILNENNGLKIIDNYGSYFQATADKIGFYDRWDHEKMYINSDGNAVFTGKITAAEFATTGSELSFGSGLNKGALYVANDGLHLKKVTIDEDCIINGSVTADIGYLGSWQVGNNFLGNTSKSSVSANSIGMSAGGTGTNNMVFWAGGYSNPNFYINTDGKLYASGAEISGNTTIDTTGNIIISGGSFEVSSVDGGNSLLMEQADLSSGIVSSFTVQNQREEEDNTIYNKFTLDEDGISIHSSDTNGALAGINYNQFCRIVLDAPFIMVRGGGNVTGTDSVSNGFNRIVVSDIYPASKGTADHILWIKTSSTTDRPYNIPDEFTQVKIYFRR